MVARKPAPKKPVKIPRLEFRYSWVYDQLNRQRFTDPLYPSSEKIREYVERISPLWKRRERTLLKAISRISGLPWREDKIIIYVLGRAIPFSDPLTMPIYEDHEDYFIDVLVHELIHQNLSQPGNEKRKKAYWDGLFEKYREEGHDVSVHIPVYAIHKEIYIKYFGGKNLVRDLTLVSKLPDQRRAWEIVNELGHRKIIEQFRRGRWD
jgi:hypothetical protein